MYFCNEDFAYPSDLHSAIQLLTFELLKIVMAVGGIYCLPIYRSTETYERILTIPYMHV